MGKAAGQCIGEKLQRGGTETSEELLPCIRFLLANLSAANWTLDFGEKEVTMMPRKAPAAANMILRRFAVPPWSD